LSLPIPTAPIEVQAHAALQRADQGLHQALATRAEDIQTLMGEMGNIQNKVEELQNIFATGTGQDEQDEELDQEMQQLLVSQGSVAEPTQEDNV
jgi:hypothetical protein